MNSKYIRPLAVLSLLLLATTSPIAAKTSGTKGSTSGSASGGAAGDKSAKITATFTSELAAIPTKVRVAIWGEVKAKGKSGDDDSASSKAKGLALVQAQLDGGIAHVVAIARGKASDKAKDDSKHVKAHLTSPTVEAHARGGLHPYAWTKIGKLTFAEALSGVGASAKGGKYTVVKHYGPHGMNEVAITFINPGTYSGAYETPKMAAAFSQFTKTIVHEIGPKLIAAIQMVLEADTKAWNNSATGHANVVVRPNYAIGADGSAGSEADMILHATATVWGVPQKDPPAQDPTIAVTIAEDAAETGAIAVRKICTWQWQPEKLVCHTTVEMR